MKTDVSQRDAVAHQKGVHFQLVVDGFQYLEQILLGLLLHLQHLLIGGDPPEDRLYHGRYDRLYFTADEIEPLINLSHLQLVGAIEITLIFPQSGNVPQNCVSFEYHAFTGLQDRHLPERIGLKEFGVMRLLDIEVFHLDLDFG